MWVKILEVGGRPVKKRVSLGGALNYIEAGETKEVEDAVGEMLVTRHFCTEEELPEDSESMDRSCPNGPGEDEEESEVQAEAEDEVPNY